MTSQISRCQRLLISLAFVLSAATCLPASAGDQTRNEWPSTIVKAGDLDLSTDAGRRALLERLSKAAAFVCEQYANANWALGYTQVYRSCLRSSLAAAVDRLHHEELSALYAASSRPDTP